MFICFVSCESNEKASSSEAQLSTSKTVLATIDGEKITLQDYQQSLQHIRFAYAQLRGTPSGKKNLKKLQQELLDQLIVQRLMLKEAKRLHLGISPVELKEQVQTIKDDYSEGAFAKTLRQEGLNLAKWEQNLENELLVKKLISQEVEDQINITDEEIRKYFEEHQDEFKQPELVRVRQIVLESEVEANNLWKKLRRGADFVKLAETHSLSPGGAKGGDLGYFAHGQMPAEFDEVAFNLKRKRQISDVFSTSYGYHIFQLVDRKAAHDATLDEVKPKIKEKLRRQRVEVTFQSWLNNLKFQAKIKINPYFIKNSQ